MPPAIPFIAAAAEAAGGFASIAMVVIRTVVVNLLLSRLVNVLTSKPGSSGPPPVNVSVRSTVDYRRIVLGTARCGGSFAFYRTSGTNNKYLWYVIVYAGHQVSALKDAYVDTRFVPSADINASTGTVSTSTFNSKLFIWDHLGTGSQTVDAQLNSEFSSIFDTNHRLRGCAYRVIRMERDDTAWPNGAPQSISSVVDGALLYDPRLDSTNGGSGSHRLTDPSTWAFSGGIGANPALQVRWFLSGGSVVNDQSTRMIFYGLRETDSRIDDSYTRAAANRCDESLSGANAPPSGAQVRYACGIELSCGQTRREILSELLATMGPGQLAYVHGTWRMYAAGYDAPVHDFTQDDLYGEMVIEDTSSAADRFNSVAATYTDAGQGYVSATSIFRTNSSYVTQDANQSIPKTIILRGVTDPYRAQRIAEITNRSSRFMRTATFKFGRQGMKVANWETLTFSHARYGWSNRLFRCQNRQLEYQNDGAVLMVITGKQDDASIYTDLLTADYTTGTTVTQSIQNEAPDAPTALVATVLGGQNIRFDWTLGTFWQLNGIIELWMYTAASPFSSATMIWQGRGGSIVITFGDTTTRYYWVRMRTIGGQVSATFPSGNGLAAAANQIGTGDVADNAITDTVQSTPADGTKTYGTISTGVTFHDDYVITSVSYTNPTSSAISMEILYKGLFALASANLSGLSHGIFMGITGSVSYTENLYYIDSFVAASNAANRGGGLTVSVAGGGSITVSLHIYLTALAGTYPSPPTVDWWDVALTIQGAKK